MFTRLRLGTALLVLFGLILTTFHFGRLHLDAVENINQPIKDEDVIWSPPNAAIPDVHVEKSAYVSSASLHSGCSRPPTWLRELEGSPDFKAPFRFARRDIIVEEISGSERLSVTKLDRELLPQFQEIKQLNEPRLSKSRCLPPLTVQVSPRPAKIDASHILLAAATTVERLDATIPFYQRWLSNTGIRLVVDINGKEGQDPDRQAMQALEARMQALGMSVTLVATPDSTIDYVSRYFGLIKLLYKHKDEKTKWAAFIDDDTFFTSMPSLISRLAEYDPRKPWYIGALSEEWWTVATYGMIAIGGAGVFVSLPLLDVLNANFQNCKENMVRNGGDQQLAECIEMQSDTHLTTLDGLYQVDIHGDKSGMFESGRPMLSQHHWKEGYWSEDGSGEEGIRHPRWYPMDAMSLVSEICGGPCFLQRWQFGEDTILSNGYSIAVYPDNGLKDLQLFKMEKTWPTHKVIENTFNQGFDHYLGPVRPALELDRQKIQYRFMSAKVTKQGSIRQYYRHLGREGELDTIIELHWLRKDMLDTSVN